MSDRPWIQSLARTLLLPTLPALQIRSDPRSEKPRRSARLRRGLAAWLQPWRTTLTGSPLASPPPPTRSFSTRKACSL